MPDIIIPSIDSNPGKIRHRLMPISKWEESGKSRGLYPGQIGVATNIPELSTNQAYLRVGPYSSTNTQQGFLNSLKIVPEPGTITYSMMANIAAESIIGNIKSTSDIPQSIGFRDLTENRLIKYGGSNKVGVVNGDTTSVNWDSATPILNKNGTWTYPLKAGTVTTEYNSGSNSMSISNNSLNLSIKVPKIGFSGLSGTINSTSQIVDGAISLGKISKASMVNGTGAILSTGSSSPDTSDTSLFFFNTSTRVLSVNTSYTSNVSNWVNIVGVWG